MLNIDGLSEAERWMELRDRMGRLWARYDPYAERMEFRRGDVRVIFELRSVRAQAIRAVDTRQQGTDVLE
ncbi:MAG TPA: hypothetical protein PL105_13695 [Caldilineaceae bacterium]|nr:hypothetical protein [Caldilineaceae bacterium]